ncbi:hypothetical protein [Pseudooceanicola aestuarii]|uniref:hypothetical protein n=1 Tax=Pseudooceanicola aestuarii TaxID=2697319 RepID=UPI0013D08305|nr:hypothetical protein [Pseudooceanicola aestuarii]
MIGTDDIRAAVAAGVLSERQAAALTALAHSRTGAREGLDPGDEPFELFRGFNEIFIIVGLLILAAGYTATVGVIVGDNLDDLRVVLLVISVLSGALVWALSEYFIRRRRMIGPAILLTLMFTTVAVFGFGNWLSGILSVALRDYESFIAPGLLAMAAVLVYWLRFRVPFALAVVAVGLFAIAQLAVATRVGTPEDLTDIFLLSNAGGFGWITLVLGLLTFAVAMRFDASDPHRVTRRAAQGFWLHLVAAPMIINTVALSVLSSDAAGTRTVLMIVMAFFALVAVLIDRRSFLLAAITYVVGVIVTLSPDTNGELAAWVILGLGVALVLLGANWARFRGMLVTRLPLGRFRAFLPPAHLERLS